jgi:integrase
VASIAKRPNGQWRARYREAAGKEHSKHFDRKTDAQRWLDEVTAAIVTGQYVDPRSGRITFREYAERWRATQVHRLTTQDYIEGNLRRHAYPVLGDKALSSIKPSEVQAWVKGMADRLAPSTVGVVHGVVSGIFRAAVRDRLIVANPCDGTRLPKTTPSRVEPLPVETVHALADAVPARYRALVILAAGSGMRQGECLGLTVDRLDFLRRVVHVDRQLVTVTGRPSFLTAPKTVASVRTIPLPQVVLDALAAPGRLPAARRWVRVRHSRRQSHPSHRVRGCVAGCRQGRGRAGWDGLSSVAAFLCQLVDQAWRECQDGASAARSRVGERDARYLLPPLARQRRSHPHGGRFCTFCGLCADWEGRRWT